MNDSNKSKKLISIAIAYIRNMVLLNQENYMNGVYKENIGTLYNGSEKESNEFLRIKNRFKRQHRFKNAYVYESMGR